MPLAGLGTGGYWAGNQSAVYAGVRLALSLGYRHLDTALGYRTQGALARAIDDSKVAREDLFLVSKVPGGLNGSETAHAIEQSLAELRTTTIDLMLIHSPGSWAGVGSPSLRQESWRALEAAWARGQLRAIGVSHFCPRHVEDLLKLGGKAPIAVNQVEYHCGMGPSSVNQTDGPGFDRLRGILFESFMPFCGQCHDDELLNGELTTGIGKAHGKTGAQVALRWLVQQGIPVIPRSGSAKHQAENLAIFDFQLSADEMRRLSAFTKPKLGGLGHDCSVP
jgi:diketogulonate reductase-like aldo/keto reductase